MNFVETITVTANTSMKAPVITKVSVGKGYILSYDIRLLSGTDLTVSLRMIHQGKQIIPRNNEAVLFPVAIFMNLPDFIPIFQPPYEVTIETANSTGSGATVVVVLFMVSPDELEKMSGYRAAIP
jgi:hypothetical protein